MNKQYWYFLIYLDGCFEDENKRSVSLQKCILYTKGKAQKPIIFVAIEEISFNFDIKREVVSDLFYQKDEDDSWIDYHNVRKIIRSTIKNEYVGDSLYDFGTSIVEEDFWKYMMRKRKSQKTMTKMLKERFKKIEELF